MNRYNLMHSGGSGYPLHGAVVDPKYTFQKGKPPGPGAPKGLMPLRTQFVRALKQFSKYKVPESYCAELRQKLDIEIEHGQMTVAQFEALKLHMLAMAGVEWAYDKIYGKNLMPDIDTATSAEGLEVETTGDTTLRMVRITHKEGDQNT